MQVETRDFGAVEVSEEQIIKFPNGVFGFEDSKRFALLSPLGEDVYPMWLQSLEDVSPCFIVFDPLLIDFTYKFSFTKEESELLQLPENSTPLLRMLAIAKVPSDYRQTTVNMKSPIAINSDKNIAAQIILPYDYQFRFPIYESESGT